MTAPGKEKLTERVRERYAAAALTVLETGGQASCCDADCGAAHGDGAASCCGPTVLEVDETFGGALYSGAERDELPVAAVAASLGCGNPTAVAELREGERVLDLGSGGGIDVLLSARRVGPTGFAYGVDMTDEMLELACDQQLRHQPVHCQAEGHQRDVPSARAWWSNRNQRCRRARSSHSGRAC